MKTTIKMIGFLLLVNVVLAQEAVKPTPPAPTPALPAALSTTPSKSTVVIDSKARANDYVHAFDLLRKDKPTLKILVRTPTGTIPNVIELSAAPGGTLLWIKVLSNQGTKIQAVPVEEILEIAYSP